MGCPNWDFFFASWQVEHPTGCSQVLGVPHSRVFYSPQTHRGGRGHQVFQIPKTVKDMEVVSHTFAGLVCLRVFLKAAGAIDCCHIYIKPLRAHHLKGGLWPSGLYWRVPDQPQVSVRVQTAPPQPTVQAVSQSTLLKGILSWQMECTHDSNVHYASSLPTKGKYKLWEPSASTARAHSIMKTRFWAIFLQVLEVITAYASSASVPVTSWPRRMSLRNMQEWLRGWLVWRQSGVLSVRANSLLSWRRYTRTRLLLTGKLKNLSIGSSYVFF